MPEPAAHLGLPVSVAAKTKALTRRGSVQLYYELEGPHDAPPMLLLRGLSRSSAYWLEFRELLARERRVLTIDNRGVGRSDCPRRPWTIRDMADDAAHVIAESGLERVDVFGLSLGGMIAQELALRHPERVRRLVLGATTPGGRSAKRIAPLALFALLRAVGLPFDRGLRSTAPFVLSARALEERREIVDVWIAIAHSEPRHPWGVLFQLAAAARHDTWDRLPGLRAPTLLLTGDRDRLIDADNSRLLAGRLPDAELTFLEGAGHDFPTERPHETLRAIRAFLER